MAIGADLLAKPRAGVSPSTSNASWYSGAPKMNDTAVSNAVNNSMAAGVGAGRTALSGMTRAGISRGKGHQYAADIAEADAGAKSREESAGIEMGAAAANASAQQMFENMQKNERLSTEGLLENLRSQQNSERIAKQGWANDMYQTMRRGQFSRDQMRLDMSPLWQKLFS